jgi:hypothetical protein
VVGIRWRRLNYGTLGQNILDPNCLGLMVHVHTFRDLSEANLAATWGKRYALGERDQEFPHGNPYRTLEVSDHFGRHGRVPNPPADKEHTHITLSKAYWFGAEETPKLVRDSGMVRADDGAGHLFVHGEEWFDDAGDYLQYKAFMRRADRNFVLRAGGRPDVKAALSLTFFTHASEKVRELELVIPPDEYARMAKGVAYSLRAVNSVPGYQWKVRGGVTVTRK